VEWGGGGRGRTPPGAYQCAINVCERHESERPIKSVQAPALCEGDILRPVAFPLLNIVHDKLSLLMFLSL
jgi:hypothetical protein